MQLFTSTLAGLLLLWMIPALSQPIYTTGNTPRDRVGIQIPNPLFPLHVNTSVLVADRSESQPILLPDGPSDQWTYSQASLFLSAQNYRLVIPQSITFNSSASIHLSADLQRRQRALTMRADSADMSIVFQIGDQERLRINPDNYVGIGTATPGTFLDISGPNRQLRLTDADNNKFWQLSSSANALAFRFQEDQPDENLALWMQANGQIGIGTSTPAEQLHVIGTTRTETLLVDRTITTQVLTLTVGQDLAERFPIESEPSLSAGCVLVIDEKQPGRLRLSTAAYDKKVAGVISGAGDLQAGIVLGDEQAARDQQAVALAGRVYVKANSGNGEIRPGDLLTTSAVPGEAMKVTDFSRAQGAILGKAMSTLDPGSGLVLVLVSLQ